jgi:hypothetical protein
MQTVLSTRSELAAWSAAAVSQDAVQKRRTQRLFDLAVEATGLTRKRLARALGIDLRSLDDMRELPSIDYVGRIGGALGLHAAQAVGIVALPTREDREPSEFAVLVRAADLHDDAGALESLSSEVIQTRRSPGAIALSLALAARAKCARGDTAVAVAELDAALRLEIDPCDGAEFDALVDCVRGEHLLGCPWLAPQRLHRPSQLRARRAHARLEPAPPTALEARRRAFALAFDLLYGLAPDPGSFEVGRALGALAALRTLLEMSVDAVGLGRGDGGVGDPGTCDPGTCDPGTCDPGTCDPGAPTQDASFYLEERGVGLQPFEPNERLSPSGAAATDPERPVNAAVEAERFVGLAWIASICAAAALRAAELARPSPKVEHAAMQLLVQSEFTLEECAEASGAARIAIGGTEDGGVSALLRTRRSRIQMIEWCQRVRAGEDPYPSVAEEDRGVLDDWSVRFPRWCATGWSRKCP